MTLPATHRNLIKKLGLAALNAPAGHVDPAAGALLTPDTIAAGRAIVESLRAEQDAGLRLRRIDVECLRDPDAGETPVVLIVAVVEATPEAGNAAWDRCLGRAEAIAAAQSEAAAAWGSRINLSLRWRDDV